jgi:glycosyltransferase involved in cell wall biosynthesis
MIRPSHPLKPKRRGSTSPALPPPSRRLLVVSHPAVLPVNQLVYGELAARGWQVHLAVPKQWHHEYSPVNLIPVPIDILAGSFLTLRVAWAGRPQRHFYLENLFRIIRSARPDVVFIEQEPSSLAAFQWGVAAYLLQVPFGVQMDENLDRKFPFPVRHLRSWVLRRAAFVAARSPTAASLARTLGAEGEVVLVPHHVPGWKAQSRDSSETFRVGFAGRLVPEKGIDVLAEAIRRMEPPLELVVAGDGPLRAWLAGQDLGAAKLHFLDRLEHSKMDAAYHQMDVLVLPSRATPTWVEQFGRVLVEALSCGVPVVGSDTGEIRWVIETTLGGAVFPDGDSAALAHILGELRDDLVKRQAFAEQGALLAQQYFSVDAVTSVLGSVLDRASARLHPWIDLRPRVALVAHGIHDGGGMERACAELIRHAHNTVRFTVVSADLAADLQPLAERWVHIRIPRRPIPLKFVAFFLFAGLAIRREHPDLVHTVGAVIPNRVDVVGIHSCHAGAVEALGTRMPTGPRLSRRVNTGIVRTLGIAAETWCYRPGRVRRFAAVSGGVLREVTSHYPGIPSCIVPNGVDADRFQPNTGTRRRQREAEGLVDGQVVALFVGGDWDHKGLGVALKGLALARAAGAPVWLWVVGSGNQERWAKVATATGIKQWVRFFGQCADTERFYQASDIFVLPSRHETFSLVCHEAAACGLPIIATKVNGVDELIGSNEAGILVPRTGNAVGNALIELCQHPDTRRKLGEEARRRSRAYTWQRSAGMTENLYQLLLESNETRPTE